MSPSAPPAILALSPGDLAPRDVERFEIAVARAVAAGLRGVVLREPGLEDGVTFALAAQLALVREPQAGCAIMRGKLIIWGVSLSFRSPVPRTQG